MDVVQELLRSLQKHVDAHHISRHSWPDDAEFAIRYKLSAWPYPESQNRDIVAFFKTKEQLQDKIQELECFSQMEDNYAEYQVYEWDLGPTRIGNVVQLI